MTAALPSSRPSAQRPWRKPSPAAFIGVALLVPAILLLILLSLNAEYNRMVETQQAEEASYAMRWRLIGLLSDLKDAETGQRGYVLTGDVRFLAPYVAARPAVASGLKQLSGISAPGTSQAARLDAFTAVVNGKFREMAGVIAVREREGLQAAAARVSEGGGLDLMNRACAIMGEMIEVEQRMLSARRAASQTRMERIRSIFVVVILIAGVVLALFLATIWRARMTRDRLETASQSSEQRLQAIFDSTIDAIVTLNPSGSIETINAAAARMLGYDRNELERRDIGVLLDIPDAGGSFHDRIGLVGDRFERSVLIDCTAFCKNGATIPVDVALGLMPLPSGLHIVAAIRDVSERKAVEQIKDEFLSTVSHELRTPMTSVVGALGLLRGGSAGVLPDAATRLIEIAENNSRRLIRLINDILDMEKMSAGRMHFANSELDLRAVLTEAQEGAEGSARVKNVEIALALPPEPVPIHGDADRLLQVVTNLLSNALRYSPDGGRVTLSVAAEGGRARVAVDDQGSGVPVAFRSRIFERFSQSKSPSEKASGSGLGLAISREIVHAHHGRIWFDDLPAGGTRFAFALPLVTAMTRGADPSTPRLLVCEDDDIVADVLTELLIENGYLADRAATRAEADAALASRRYAALLLDLQLPDGNGLEVMRSVRARPETRMLPIIIVSGRGQDDIAASSLDLIDWIQKPISERRLIDAVKRAIEHSNARRPTLLHIDDDLDLVEVVATALDGHANLINANSLASARAMLESETPDVVILDLGLPDGSGLDLLPMLVDDQGGAIPTIIYSAQDVPISSQRLVEAVLVKSRRSLPNLVDTIRAVLRAREEEKAPQ